MDAQQLQAIVKPFGVIGLVILDANDPSTWTFQGAAVDRAAVLAAIQAATGPADVSRYWPRAQTALERDVAILKQKAGL